MHDNGTDDFASVSQTNSTNSESSESSHFMNTHDVSYYIRSLFDVTYLHLWLSNSKPNKIVASQFSYTGIIEKRVLFS